MSRMADIKKDTSPKFWKRSFKCPYPDCGTLAEQRWHHILDDDGKPDDELMEVDGETIYRSYYSAECIACGRLSFWANEKMLYPLTPNTPKAHKKMSDGVKEIYEEARNVEPHSKRAAAALLRLSLEKLTEELGEKNGSLHTRIAKLKKKGLSDEVIEALEIVHITASEGGAHAGVIDLENKDTPDIVNTLFKIVNFIVEQAIVAPEERKKLREYVKEKKKAGRGNHNNQK